MIPNQNYATGKGGGTSPAQANLPPYDKTYYTLGIYDDGINGNPKVGNETRPINFSIKVWKRTL